MCVKRCIFSKERGSKRSVMKKTVLKIVVGSKPSAFRDPVRTSSYAFIFLFLQSLLHFFVILLLL